MSASWLVYSSKLVLFIYLSVCLLEINSSLLEISSRWLGICLVEQAGLELASDWECPHTQFKTGVIKHYWEVSTDLTERCAYCYSLPATGGTVPQKRTVANSPLTSTLLPITSNGTMSLIIGQQESKIRDLGRKTWQTDKSLISRNCGLHWPQELKLTANPSASIAHVLG